LNAHALSAVELAWLCVHVGATPLFWAAGHGRVEAIAILLAAGASVAALDTDGHSCLSWAAMYGHTAALRQLLQAWRTPPADVLRRAVQSAAEHDQWDAAVLLMQPLGQQDMSAAAEAMQAMPSALPALLDAVMSSEEEQLEAALQDGFRQLAEQRRGL
jgi:hypothetical protein